MAEKLTEQSQLASSIAACRTEVMNGSGFYDAAKKNQIFSGFDLQLLRVASRAGCLDRTLKDLSDDYDQKCEAAMDAMIAALEPAIVSILAIAVGLVLLSVMLPLAGILSAIG